MTAGLHSAVLEDDRRPVGLINGNARHEAVAFRDPRQDASAELSVVVGDIAQPGIVEAAGFTLDDFYSQPAQALHRIIRSLRAVGAPLSLSTIRHFLSMPQQAELLASLGGQSFFEQIEVREHDILLFEYYANIVRKNSRVRHLKERALSIASACDDASQDAETILAERGDFSDLYLPEPDSFTARALIEAYPRLAEGLVDGLIRRGETANLVAPTKIGKSWLTYNLALSIITGRDWFGFPTRAGRVLLVDNELHRETLADRLQKVADAMGLRLDDFADSLTVWPLRGKGMDVHAIGRKLNRVPKGFFAAIIIDAKYRALPVGTSENDNTAETAFYNEEDRWAVTLDSSVINVHHSTKGDQSEKRLTDLGAGGGAQSRAADAHIALREHEEEGAFVLEAAVRSFAPVQPIGLTWEFPLWVANSEVDTTRLKRSRTKQEECQAIKDREADQLVLDACATWKTVPEIRRLTGFGADRATRAIGRLTAAKLLDQEIHDRPRNPGAQVFRKSVNAA